MIIEPERGFYEETKFLTYESSAAAELIAAAKATAEEINVTRKMVPMTLVASQDHKTIEKIVEGFERELNKELVYKKKSQQHQR